MMMRRTIISALALAGATVAIALPSAAVAGRPDCPAGSFCAWFDANYEGERIDWSGGDWWWELAINDDDSSWQNNGYTNVKRDHVEVFEHELFGGQRTLCLEPGQSVPYSRFANDRGGSHGWVARCV